MADWKLQKVTVNIIDDSNFLASHITVGEFNSSNGWKYNVGADKKTVQYSAAQASVYLNKTCPATSTNGCWNEEYLFTNQSIAFGADYGITDKDYIELANKNGLDGYSKVKEYAPDFISSPTHGNNSAYLLLRSGAGMLGLRNTSTQWPSAQAYIKDNMSWLNTQNWQALITKAFGTGSQRMDSVARKFYIRVGRGRKFEVDYGTTIGELMSNSNLPTEWKRDGGALPAVANWELRSIGSTNYGDVKLGTKTSEKITGYTTIFVRY